MGQIFVGRQPIVDRRRRVVAYELLFRASATAESAVFESTSIACMRVIVNTFASMGVKAVLGECLAFVNVDGEVLHADFIEALPAGRVVIEVLEDTQVDDRLLSRCQQLAQLGFTIALDDYVPDDPRKELLEVASLVKVDLPALSQAQLRSLVRELKGRGLRTLAEKVETRESYELCRRLGFDLFQGYFFARPAVLESVTTDPARTTLVSMLQQIQRDEDTSSLVETLKQNVALGLNLLRLVNSARFATRTEIGSIEDALNYLGRQQLRRWVLVLLYAGEESDGLRGALLQTAAHRGRLMESVMERRDGRAGKESEGAFLVGMLSLVDVLLSRPLDAILSELELEASLQRALLTREGPLGRLLCLVEAIERADWPRVEAAIGEFGLDLEGLRQMDERVYAWLHEFVASSAD